MTEALGKVKTLTDENIRLEENNTKLAEEVAQLKAALAAKKKVVEDAEEMSGDEEITPPPIKPIPLKEDVEREEKKGPTDSEMVDLGLDDAKA
ncbi:putative transmembrane protein [Sesbania bispinosa]|nr:putative transmembrane protein [Sesbania bispinosa]